MMKRRNCEPDKPIEVNKKKIRYRKKEKRNGVR